MGTGRDAAGYRVPHGAAAGGVTKAGGARGPQLSPVANWDKRGVRPGPILCPRGFGDPPTPIGHSEPKRGGKAQKGLKIQVTSTTTLVGPGCPPLSPYSFLAWGHGVGLGTQGWFGDTQLVWGHRFSPSSGSGGWFGDTRLVWGHGVGLGTLGLIWEHQVCRGSASGIWFGDVKLV